MKTRPYLMETPCLRKETSFLVSCKTGWASVYSAASNVFSEENTAWEETIGLTIEGTSGR